MLTNAVRDRIIGKQLGFNVGWLPFAFSNHNPTVVQISIEQWSLTKFETMYKLTLFMK
jgi:hypothetical protein